MSPGIDAPPRLVRPRRTGKEPPLKRPLPPARRRSLHEALRRARFNHAVFRTETLITLVVTILATTFVWLGATELPLPDWSGIAVPLVGLTVAALLVATTFTDPVSIGAAIAAALEEHLDLAGISDEAIRSQIAQAVTHRARMEEVQFRAPGNTRRLGSETFVAVDEWLSGMGHLAHRLEFFQTAFHLKPETRLPLVERIRDLERRIGESADRRTKEQLRETLAGRRHQLRTIEELESLVERGLLRLEHAVAALGTIHAQIAIFAARDADAGGIFAPDINAEIREIDAVLLALDRVYVAARSDNDEGVEQFATPHPALSTVDRDSP